MQGNGEKEYEQPDSSAYSPTHSPTYSTSTDSITFITMPPQKESKTINDILPIECLIHSFQFLDIIQVMRLAKTCKNFDKIATTTIPLKFRYCANIIPPTTDVTSLEIYTLFNLFGEFLKRIKIDTDVFEYNEKFLPDRTLHLITNKGNINIETLALKSFKKLTCTNLLSDTLRSIINVKELILIDCDLQ